MRPGNGTGLQQAARLLGSAILTKTTRPPGRGAARPAPSRRPAARRYWPSYAQALLSISGQPSVPATLAVVVTPGTPPSGGDSNPADQGLITLAQQLNTAGLGTLMAGSTTGSVAGSAIDALRASNAGGQISSVDDADTTPGRS